LHALVAEAKRRALRRRVLLAVAVVVLAGGAAGAVVVAHPFGWLESSASAVDYQPGYLITCSGCRLIAWNAPPVTVSASSRSGAWAVGSGIAWHWDGQAWRSVPAPPGVDLQSVTSLGPDEAWAVGSGTLTEHWNGTKWVAVPVAARLSGQSLLSSVSAAGRRNLWALGTVSTGRKPPPYALKESPLLLRWDGTAWLRQALPWASGRMAGEKVVATGPSSAWVVAEALPSRAPGSSVLQFWNGTTWHAVPAPFGPKDPILGFTATAWDDAWAVGSYAKNEYGVLGSQPLAAHWDGSRWQMTPLPARPGPYGSLLTDVVSIRPNDVWAAGLIQRVHPYEAFGPSMFMVHWDGQRWTAAPGSVGSDFFSSATLAAASDGTAWAITNCGDDNVVLRWSGVRWKVVPHPPDQQARMAGPGLGPRPTSSCASRSGG
jgi:hypothetical protein